MKEVIQSKTYFST